MILIDSNFFVALFNSRDKNHQRAKILLKELKNATWGSRIITDYVIDETVTMLWVQTHSKKLVKDFYNKIVLNKKFSKMEKITSEDINKTWELWNKYAEYPKRPLSFTDCSILAIIERLQIANVLTFDSEFDGLASIVV